MYIYLVIFRAIINTYLSRIRIVLLLLIYINTPTILLEVPSLYSPTVLILTIAFNPFSSTSKRKYYIKYL